MRKIAWRIIALSILIPGFTFAAYNDVTMTTDTVINVAGINLNVSGMSAVVETITVGTSSFSFTLQPGSSIKVTSPDRRVLQTNATTEYIGDNICTTEQSVLAHYANTGSPTITITPSAFTCTTVPVASGAGYFVTVSPTVKITPSNTTTISPNDCTGTNTFSTTTDCTITNNKNNKSLYIRVLTLGSEGSDVVALQTFLETKGFLVIPGSIAKGHFGQATKKALAKYQSNVGLPAIGIFGPVTRAKIEAESGFKTPLRNPAAVSTYSRNLSIGARGDDVSSLQIFLEAKGFLVMPEGTAKGYFGQATKAALMKYQQSVGISAIGVFGPATRAYLNALP